MFERFETSARHAIVLAQDESRRLNHEYIGTEHELLGLLRTGDPVVQAAVGSKLSLESARTAVEDIIGRGASAPSGHIPFTPRAKKVLELSLREALRLRHRGIDAGHVLLGLMREGEGVGAQVLAGAGIDFDEARVTIVEALGPGTAGPEPPSARGFLRSFRRRPTVEGEAGFEAESVEEQILVQLRRMCTDGAAHAVDRAVEGGIDGVPTPWSLLRGIAAGDDAAASIVAGLDLSAPVPPPEEPVGRPFMAVFQRSQGLASALGSTRPIEGPLSERVPERPEIDTPHLLGVLLSPGEGSVAEGLAALGADPVELRRQVLALL
jgi:Clp amino terminal domain, pathogenicity island component